MQDIHRLGNIMGIWAHPDDETYAMGGLFALASKSGQKTTCITATRGELGIQDESRWPVDRLADIRTSEMNEAMVRLGVEQHHWLDYKDGQCKDVDINEATGRLAELINKYRPGSIFTFGPDGMTGHDDHKTMSKWVDMAVGNMYYPISVYHTVVTRESYESLKKADKEFNMFFNTEEPCICSKSECSLSIDLSEDILDIKMSALESMPSQTEYLLSKHKESVRNSGRTESFMLSRSN